MGFYGNITNVSRTQFQFDKIYPNRKAMEQAKITDGIYLGRYVLVEYDNNGLDGMKEVIIEEEKYYYGTPNNKTLLTWQNTYINEVVYTTGDEKYIFYKRNEQPSDASDNSPATFTQFTSGNEDTYSRNYAIDNDAYKSSRGYDSTVWQKVYSDEQEKYVMIAELNTVVPTFAIAADAPTMTPVVPHFDTQSTDVYYKLHMQNPWIVRVAEAKNGAPSDATIKWQEVIKNEKKEVGEQYEIVTTEKNGAIYFNRAAFESQVGESTISKKADGENKITIDLVSSGLELYDDHNNTTDKPISADDIQELTINLPAIGNMMSDAWDIIHGPNRDNSMAEFELNEDGSKKIGEDGKPIRTDSLQGRLNSIAAMNDDEIPVKRGSDGALIGATINGGKTSNSDLTGKNDDAWIETMVNGNIESITIKHTFNKVNDINTESNKNIDQVASDLDSDKIDLYTPIVDAMGHIVGKNTETVTLPYGFKTISVANKSESTSGVAAAAGNVVADNTQDTLTLAPGNKWIHITADANNDTVTLSHEVNNTSSDEATTNWTQTEADTTIPVVTYEYDEAGHYIKHHTENYQLPFGYGKIKGDSGDTAATATYDELIFTSDEWLTATVDKDKVTYSHDYPEKVDDTTSEYNVNNNGDTIVLETLARDEKGHVTKVNQNTVTLPFSYKTFTGDSGSSSANNTQDTMSVTGDSWMQTKISEDKIELSHIGPVAVTAVKVDDITPKFGETFDIIDWYYDAKGHKSSNNTHTVKIPLPSLKNGTGNVVTGLVLNAAEGALTETKNNISNLLLTDYSKKTNSADVDSADALGDALSKLQTQIHNANNNLVNEKSRAEAAEAKTLQDAKAYTDTVKENLLGDGIKDTFNTLVEIQNWIEGDGVNTTELTQAIADEATARTNAINALGSAAYREEVYFVSKAKYDLDMNTKDAQINGLNMEAKRLTNEVIALQERLTALENLIQSQATE